MHKAITVNDRRKLLSGIVFGKKSGFTAQQIIDEFKAIQGDVIIDGLETVRSFLKGLEQFGSLKLRFGQYFVIH